MSTSDDDNIEFDFFDEPETVEATQRRRLPRLERPGGRGGGERPPRPPLRAPTGLVPLARLVGLIAIAIVVVVGLVFWVGSCQGKSKQAEYQSYADKVQNLVDSIELRAKGLAGLADALANVDVKKSTTGVADALTKQGALLAASDVVWEQLYQSPATQQMKDQGVTGVAIPASQFVPNTDIVSARSFSLLVQRLSGASVSGTPSGKHGDALVSVRVTPQGVDLSTSSAPTLNVSADMAVVVTVEDSGDFQETSVPVLLTIDAG